MSHTDDTTHDRYRVLPRMADDARKMADSMLNELDVYGYCLTPVERAAVRDAIRRLRYLATALTRVDFVRE